MAKLHLPEGADDILRRTQQALPQREGTKLLVYGLQDVIKNEDIEGLCQIAAEMYSEEVGDDCEDPNFIVPAPQTRWVLGKDVQEVLDMHIFGLTKADWEARR